MGEPSLRSVIWRDIRHGLDGPLYTTPAKRSLRRTVVGLMMPELEIVVRYRIYNALYRRGYTKLAYALYLTSRRRTKCDLAMQATIGPGLRIAHASDIVVGSGAVIGEDCELFNGVSLGNEDFLDPEDRMPRLGDRVIVGTGAKLLGPIEIGDDAFVGAGSIVLRSVEPGTVVAGVPARPVSVRQT